MLDAKDEFRHIVANSDIDPHLAHANWFKYRRYAQCVDRPVYIAEVEVYRK